LEHKGELLVMVISSEIFSCTSTVLEKISPKSGIVTPILYVPFDNAPENSKLKLQPPKQQHRLYTIDRVTVSVSKILIGPEVVNAKNLSKERLADAL
jgi:hypothetical protein